MTSIEDKPVMSAVLRSLTGFDEVAIKSMFGSEITAMSGSTMGRALVFILRRRAGLDDGTAFKESMNLPLGDLDDSFSPEPQDEFDNDQGKASTDSGLSSS